MADSRFFSRSGPFTVAQLAEIAEAEILNAVERDRLFVDVAPLDEAGPDDIGFLDNHKYVDQFVASKAGACVIASNMVERAPPGMVVLVSKDPYRAYARIARAFYPKPAPEPWLAPTAWIDPSARLGDGCRVEPGAVISARAELGRRCHVGPNAVVGAGVVVGDDCTIGANASVSHALIGERVLIYPGVRIGQDGYGFAMGPQGHLRVPQLGRVIVGNDVEIGANTTIDRGAGPDTVIGDGSMIDNLVQIGHNVQLGRGCVIVAQVGISGSTRLGDFVVLAGQVGITGHLEIGSGARVAGQSGVMRDVAPGETVGGSPAMPMAEWLRQSAMLARLVRRK